MGNLNVGRGGEPNAPTADSHERDSELLIHGKDGQIQECNTYKRDPYPPA